MKALGEQARPVGTDTGTVIGSRVVRQILLTGFESDEMHKGYLAWLKSGDAHAAFGTWADENGL